MSHSANQREKPCTIYVQQDEQNMPTSQEIQKTLATSKSIDDKIAAIKNLVISLIHDESFPPMMLTIINYVLPVQNESHNLKKVLLYYWEVKIHFSLQFFIEYIRSQRSWINLVN